MTNQFSCIGRIAATVLCLAWLAACAPNTPEAIMDTDTKYPFLVDSRMVTQPVIFVPGQTAISKVDIKSLNVFVHHFFKSGGHKLDIRISSADDDAQGKARLETLRRHILRLGVRPGEITLHRIDGVIDRGGPMILSFESYSVRPIECTQRNVGTSPNPSNTKHPDHGCSLRAGIAAMIANPADLQSPRPEGPAFGARRGRVLRNYGEGQPTEGARGDNESSGSIRDLGGG